jgi:chromate transporter
MQVGTLSVPVLASVNWPALAIAIGAMVAIFRFRCGIIPVLAASCAAGVVLHLAQLA